MNLVKSVVEFEDGIAEEFEDGIKLKQEEIIGECKGVEDDSMNGCYSEGRLRIVDDEIKEGYS